jgi:hypothetical protein
MTAGEKLSCYLRKIEVRLTFSRRNKVRWTNRRDFGFPPPCTLCNPSPSLRAESLAAENKRKKWVYTPTNRKS